MSLVLGSVFVLVHCEGWCWGAIGVERIGYRRSVSRMHAPKRHLARRSAPGNRGASARIERTGFPKKAQGSEELEIPRLPAFAC